MDLIIISTILEEVSKEYPIKSRVKLTAEDDTYNIELLERGTPKDGVWKTFDYNVSNYSSEDLKNLLTRYAVYLKFGKDADNYVH